MTADQITTLDHPETRRADVIAIVERAQATTEERGVSAHDDDEAATWALRDSVLERITLQLSRDDGGPAVLVHAPLWGWRQESVTWLVTDSTLRGYVDRICAEVIRGAYDAAEDLDEAPSLVDGAVPEWAIDRGGDDMAASIAEARARWGQAAADEVAAFIGVDA